MTLLLIEKSTLLIQRLAEMLTDLNAGELVKTASTIEEAVRVMQVIRPEIVVMDVHLSDGCDVEMLARVRGECPSACVIVLSYDSSEIYRKRILRAGADHCFDIALQIDQWMDAVVQLVIAPPPVRQDANHRIRHHKDRCRRIRLNTVETSRGGMAERRVTWKAASI